MAVDCKRREKPVFSVITAAYNAEEYISQSIQSICDQTFGDMEIIVINDGSDDATSEIAKGFVDDRIVVIDNPCNLGLSASFNTGINLSRGEFIVRQDADDISIPSRLEEQYEFMKNNQGIVICGSDMDSFGAATGTTNVPQHDGSIKARFLTGCGVKIPTSVMRRKFIINNNIRCNPSYQSLEDLDFFIQCIRKGATFQNIKKSLIKYRKHSFNNSRILNYEDLIAIRKSLGEAYFPFLSGHELRFLIGLIVGNRVNAEDLHTYEAVCKKAINEKFSFFGEDRDQISKFISLKLETLRKVVSDWKMQSAARMMGIGL